MDYGNFQYSVAYTLVCATDRRCNEKMQLLALNIPTLDIYHADTHDALVHKGDVMETCIASVGPKEAFREAWTVECRKELSQSVIEVSRCIDFLSCCGCCWVEQL